MHTRILIPTGGSDRGEGRGAARAGLTIKTAIETALASGAVKKLSDHRVVHGS
jgi:hypothetical protein